MSWAVVTGASRGIGRATALALAQRGCKVALVARPSNELTAAREAALAAGAPDAKVLPADLADRESLANLCHALEKEPEGVFALVNNAGLAKRATIETLSAEDWTEQLEVNLTAPFLLTRAVLPAMRRARSGRIVHIGSISSTLGTPALSAYCAAKWGLVGFMKSLAEELSDSGVMTLALLPGSVDTRMLEGSGFPPRMTTDDVARTVAYYCLEAPLAHNGAIVEMFGT